MPLKSGTVKNVKSGSREKTRKLKMQTRKMKMKRKKMTRKKRKMITMPLVMKRAMK